MSDARYTVATPEEHAALILAGFEGPDSSGDYQIHDGRAFFLAMPRAASDKGHRWSVRVLIGGETAASVRTDCAIRGLAEIAGALAELEKQM